MPTCVDKPSNITLHCHRSLENNLFSIRVKVTVPQYLANERVIVEFHILPSLVTYADSSKAKVTNERNYLFRTVPVEVCNNAFCYMIPL